MGDFDKKKRKYFIVANRFQRKILFLVFFSTLIPLVVTIIALFSLVFTILAAEMPHKEIISFNIIPAVTKTATIVVIFTPLVVLLILLLAYRVSNRLVGPLGRLYRELDMRIEKNSKAHINFRKGDDLIELTEKINKILDKLP